MIDFILFITVAVLATWALSDIYFASAVFSSVRKRTDRLLKSRFKVIQTVGYLLSCPYCLNHWIAAAVVFSLGFSAFTQFNFVVLFVAFVVTARLVHLLQVQLSVWLGIVPKDLFDEDGNLMTSDIELPVTNKHSNADKGENDGRAETKCEAGDAEAEDQQSHKG